jgi:AraC-like DNA-binding protein
MEGVTKQLRRRSMNVPNLINELAIQKIKLILNQQNETVQNKTVINEDMLIDLVMSGDTEKAQKSLDKLQLRYPIKTHCSLKKNEEYMAIAIVTLLSRSVLEAGVSAKDSCRLSDNFLTQIAQSEDINTIREVQKRSIIAFTQLVQMAKERFASNTYVDNCKKDIAINILKKISLADVAKDVGVEETYLARLFKESEGITVVHYIHKEKIKIAKNLLKYSARPISEISYYLSFTSQSYFGKVFRELTGMTPKEYRKQNQIADKKG